VLKGKYPQYSVFGSPTQQGADPPCFFVFFLPDSGVERQMGSSSMRNIGVDIVFVQETNALNAYQMAEEVADFLDENLHRIPYGQACLHTHERNWNIEDELHYQFKIRERVRIPDTDPDILEVESYHGGLK